MINKIDLTLWGRQFSLDVNYDLCTGDSISKNQLEILDLFMNNPKWIEKAKMLIEDFCKKDVASDNENQKKDNIFSYIRPHYLFIKNDNSSRLAIMCMYRYDPEHGVAIVFNKEGKIVVGTQDIIL